MITLNAEQYKNVMSALRRADEELREIRLMFSELKEQADSYHKTARKVCEHSARQQ